MMQDTSSVGPYAFVIMPFRKEFDWVLSDIIEPAFRNLSVSVVRADQLIGERNIIKDIITHILNCSIVIADLTAFNPNVYYELGLCHALNKRVILMAQDITQIPFDLRHYRTVAYAHNIGSQDKARKEIRSMVKWMHSAEQGFGQGPFIDYGDISLHLREIVRGYGTLSILDDHLTDRAFDQISRLAQLAKGTFYVAGRDNVYQENVEAIKRLSQGELIRATVPVSSKYYSEQLTSPAFLRYIHAIGTAIQTRRVKCNRIYILPDQRLLIKPEILNHFYSISKAGISIYVVIGGANPTHNVDLFESDMVIYGDTKVSVGRMVDNVVLSTEFTCNRQIVQEFLRRFAKLLSLATKWTAKRRP